MLRKPLPTQTRFGQFETLEVRACPAFSAFFDGLTSTLFLTQFSDDGIATIDNNGAGGAWRATDGSGTDTFFPASNLVIDMLDFSDDLNVDLDSFVAGDLTLELGDGNRTVNFTGTSNAVLGSVNINANLGEQTIEVATTNNFLVGVDFNVDLGSAFDTVDENDFNVSIGNNLNFIGVNQFEVGGITTIGGNMMSDTTAETIGSNFDNDGTLNLTGNLVYLGGNGEDFVQINSIATIGGNVDVDLGDSIGGSGAGQTFRMNNAGNSVGGTINVTAGTNFDGDSDDFLLNTTGTFGGDINVQYGDGPNDIQFIGVFGGTNINYTGGAGVDDVLFDMSGNPSTVNIDLGAGNDIFTLGPNASIAPTTLTVDFGDNNDTFNNNFGNFTFNAMLLGLQGFDYNYDVTADTLTASETANNGGAVEFDTNGPGSAFRFNNFLNLTAADNLIVNMLDGSGNQLDIDLDVALAGDLTVNLGDGARALNFISGVSNTILGNVAITGGSDSQVVELAVNNSFTVGGNVSIDLGAGADTVDEDGNDINIAGNLDLIGVNEFENNGNMTVGGNVFFDVSGETETSRFDDDSAMAIGGNFTYLGGDGRDEVLLNDIGITSVGGNVLIDLADNTVGGTQFAWFNGSDTTINGTTTVLSTNSAFVDNYQDAGASFGGDLLVKLGAGTNVANFQGSFFGAGDFAAYQGGSGIDTVFYDMTGNAADVNIVLRAGDDTFTLGANAVIQPTTLRVHFGGNNDTFVNNFGQFNFDANLLALHGFNHFYRVGPDTLFMNQTVDLGDVTLDNNGAGNAIRLSNGAITELTGATNVRLNLQPGTSTNVTVDLDSALAGNLIIDMKDGPRTVDFVGTSNSIGGYLRIDSFSGDTTVNLATNADLNVAGDIVANLGTGSDTIDDGANNINAGGNMVLRGVNMFENTGVTNIGGNFVFNTTMETEVSLLDNDGTMNVGGNFNYFGGAGVDDLLLNGGVGVFVSGNTIINVGDGIDGGNAQNIALTNNFSTGGNLVVRGGTATAGNLLTTDATTFVGGDVTVNFSASTGANSAILAGTYGGFTGSYRGGSGVDTVVMQATAVDMDFDARLNAGADEFTLDVGTSLLSLLVDFGADGDTDVFNDNIGAPYPFPVTILNLP